jgi:hypothetical protein
VACLGVTHGVAIKVATYIVAHVVPALNAEKHSLKQVCQTQRFTTAFPIT